MKALSEQSLNKQSKIVVQRDVVVRISADRAEKKSIAAVAAAAVSTGAAVNAVVAGAGDLRPSFNEMRLHAGHT